MVNDVVVTPEKDFAKARRRLCGHGDFYFISIDLFALIDWR